MKKLTFTLICLLAAIPCQARTIIVDANGSGEYPNIQAAIDDSNDGDTIVVADGIYTGSGNKNIDFGGRAITVRSENGPENCIIDCQGTEAEPHRGFYFHTGENANSILSGFTIKNGYAWRGGGIYCHSSSPTITNCIIRDNSAGYGGGILCRGQHSSPIITNCTISSNTADFAGGIGCWEGSNPTITNCTIIGNSAERGGGIYCYHSANLTISNSILWDNTASKGKNIAIDHGEITIFNSDIKGGQAGIYTHYHYSTVNWGLGNIDADPLFVDAVAGDYHLSADSPCINAGDPAFVPEPNQTDIDGDPRVINGLVDIGADEFNDGLPIIRISPTEFEFDADEEGSNPESQILSVRNIGAGTLSWNITENCPWLEVNPTSGESSGEVNEVTLIVDISGMSWGIHGCNLIISDPCALNNPQTAKVNLVIHGPVIELSKKEFEFTAFEDGENPENQMLTISNSGGGTLNWEITEDCNWLQVTPTTGVSVGDINETTIAVDTNSLVPGYYNCILTVHDPHAMNSPKTVAVALHVFGYVVYVPSRAPTIQGAMDLVLEGGTVIVAEGAYTGPGNRDIDFKGKTITVRSENGPENCIIDCNGTKTEPHRGFYFHTGENANSILSGFTIKNGYAWRGGGIYCHNSSPIITNCIIRDNLAGYGGGILCRDQHSSPIITNCTITGNTADFAGGIGCWESSNPTITNCTISGNSAKYEGGGIYCYRSANLTISNSILWDNTASKGKNIAVNRSEITIFNSDIQGGWDGKGNIDADPLFADANYHLSADSPCIDSGNPAFAPALGETDIDGEPRVMGGRVDIGVDEFTSTLVPVIGTLPAEFKFFSYQGGPNPESQVLSIRNIGTDLLNWSITEDCPWLEVNPTSGQSSNEVNKLTLGVDISGFPSGHYNCNLTITDPNAGNSPQMVTVNLYIFSYVEGALYVPLEYGTIQTAIDAAVDYDIVLVAPGTYTGPGNRDIDFKGKAITVRSTDPDDPNIVAATVIDCQDGLTGFDFHNAEDNHSILSGFKITNGCVGGIRFWNSSPAVTNCIISGNTSSFIFGGGITCDRDSNPIITNCRISGNSADRGGGIHCMDNSNPTITNCTITGNSAKYDGGGIACGWNNNPTIANCTITGNSAEHIGGGIFCGDSSPTITNCTITGNSAKYDGGAIYCGWNSNPTITNCTFAQNYATNGNALACDSREQQYPSNLQLANCILWDGGNEIWNNDGSTIDITYSDIQDGWPGAGNIDTDPCFVLPGYWADANDPNIIVEPNDPNAIWIEGDYHLYPFSLCINAGDPNYVVTPGETDLDGNPRIIAGRIDMGAYESNHIETRLWILPRTINRHSRQKRVWA